MSGPQQLLVARAGSAALWTMANLASPPAAWYNNDSSVTGTTNASQWNDISGSAFHLTQSTSANQPTINASGLDGKRTLQFDGTNDRMNAASGPTFRNVSYGWLVAVYRRTATDGSGTSRLLWYEPVGTSTGNTRFGYAVGQAGTANQTAAILRRLDADSAGVLAGSTISDTSWHIVLQRVEWATGDCYLYLDGGSPVSNLTITSDGATSNTAPAAPALLGCSLDGSSNPIAHADIEIAELALHSSSSNVIPSGAEIDKIFGSLAWKWGLEGNLPGGHPYASGPPTV